MSDHPWRPLGELLVQRGLIDACDLEAALTEQRLTGLLLGELLVSRRVISPMDMAAALAAQHGLAVEPANGAESPRSQPPAHAGEWRPLGRVLVERDLVTESGLQRVLLEQQKTGKPLGEILVRRGYLSAGDLAAALAAQHGVHLEASALRDGGAPAGNDNSTYELRVPGSDGAEPLYVLPSFLEATDIAFELLQAEDPDTLEIVKVDGAVRETAWSYERPQDDEDMLAAS